MMSQANQVMRITPTLYKIFYEVQKKLLFSTHYFSFLVELSLNQNPISNLWEVSDAELCPPLVSGPSAWSGPLQEVEVLRYYQKDSL